MGIYDREYYRDETSGSGWFSGTAPACRTIVLVNVVVFLLQLLAPNLQLELNFAARSTDIFQRFRVWELVTATFLHDPHDLSHIFWNMLFLWWVGREMEAMYGSREFTLLYLTAGAFSTLCWAALNYLGPEHGVGMMFGASGAVMAVVVLYTLYYPNREILLFFILPVKMWLVLVLYLGRDALALLQVLQGTPGASLLRTAFAAHLAGAFYGWAYKKWDIRLSRLLSRRPRRPRFRVVSPEPRDHDRVSPLTSGSGSSRSAAVGARREAPPYYPEEQLDAKLDEVLAKIAREGRGGLTEEENRVLQEASRRARDRRGERL